MRGKQFVRWALLTALLAGCGQKPVALSIPNAESPAQDAAPQGKNLQQPFEEAVLEESPGNQQPPPDVTRAGVSTAKLRLDVQKLWDTIRFTDESGATLAYTAVFDTELGKFTVLLTPELAPNHVRNFVALAKAGYYNGLVFEHVFQQPGDDGAQVEIVEGGCPLGTGEPGISHLGYWLKPEFAETVKHEPGTFGAYHDEAAESAACRFYINLTKAPAMDGNFTAFGRVVEGLDVVRTISGQPKIDGSIIPVKPVAIRSVSIASQRVR